MTSPLGADDHLGALNDDERAALAAWADDGDVSDGFEDRVVAAYLSATLSAGSSSLAEGSSSLAEGSSSEDRALRFEGEALATGPRATVREGRVVRLVGFCAAIAAAAAVMLMVRVLPRAEGELEVAEARGLSPAELVASEPANERPSESEVDAAEPDVDALGTEAGLVLAQHCVPCHSSTDREANAGALRIFDVEQPQWWVLMSDAQLDGARQRLEYLDAASEDDRRKLAAFLEARRRAPTHSG
jgi:hypothetical protein